MFVCLQTQTYAMKNSKNNGPFPLVQQQSLQCEVTLRLLDGLDQKRTIAGCSSSNITIKQDVKEHLNGVIEFDRLCEDFTKKIPFQPSQVTDLFDFSQRDDMQNFLTSNIRCHCKSLSPDIIAHAYSVEFMIQVICNGTAYLCLAADSDDSIRLNIVAPVIAIHGCPVNDVWQTLTFCNPAVVVKGEQVFYYNQCIHCFMDKHPNKICYKDSKKAYFLVKINLEVFLKNKNEIAFSLDKKQFEKLKKILLDLRNRQSEEL